MSKPSLDPWVLAIGGGAIVGGMLLVMLLWRRRKTLYFHRREVVRADRWGRVVPEVLGYHEVESVRFRHRRIYHEGHYMGSEVAMTLTPIVSTDSATPTRDPFVYRGKFKERKIKGWGAGFENTDELDAIHMVVSEVIAARIVACVQEGGVVRLNRRLALLPGGILKGKDLIPYERAGEFTLEPTRLLHRYPQRFLSTVVARPGETNFAAVWIALCRLAERAGAMAKDGR